MSQVTATSRSARITNPAVLFPDATKAVQALVKSIQDSGAAPARRCSSWYTCAPVRSTVAASASIWLCTAAKSRKRRLIASSWCRLGGKRLTLPTPSERRWP